MNFVVIQHRATSSRSGGLALGGWKELESCTAWRVYCLSSHEEGKGHKTKSEFGLNFIGDIIGDNYSLFETIDLTVWFRKSQFANSHLEPNIWSSSTASPNNIGVERNSFLNSFLCPVIDVTFPVFFQGVNTEKLKKKDEKLKSGKKAPTSI